MTENYKAGQETNVTGDQDINVSGTQTTTATDINRNASSGMIDTVENASGSNKETKVAGQTTTDVKLASGEEGHYIRGATESRDYLLNGTLKILKRRRRKRLLLKSPMVPTRHLLGRMQRIWLAP